MKLRYQDKVEKHLLSGKPITDAICRSKYRGTRLASIVHRLRRKGVNVVTTMKHNKKEGYTFAEYRINK